MKKIYYLQILLQLTIAHLFPSLISRKSFWLVAFARL